MIQNVTKVRARYAETDKMGFVYYGRYLEWFEVGRTELLREVGIPYAQLEDAGLALPVLEVYCNYKNSARYDQLVMIVSRLAEIPKLKIRIDYQILDEKQTLLAEGYTIHIFINESGRVVRPPKNFIDIIAKNFKQDNNARRR